MYRLILKTRYGIFGVKRYRTISGSYYYMLRDDKIESTVFSNRNLAQYHFNLWIRQRGGIVRDLMAIPVIEEV